MKGQMSQLAPDTKNGPCPGTDDDFIEGAEYDLVLDVPPKEVIRLRARIRSIERPPARLALSDAEWASLQLEENDE
jgi:hypothetical protein